MNRGRPPIKLTNPIARAVAMVLFGALYLGGIGMITFSMTRSLPATAMAMGFLPIMFAPIAWYVRRSG